MATTSNLKITKPDDNSQGWGDTLNANFDLLDRLAPIASLYVSAAETPSASLNVRITSGYYRQSTGQVGNFAGTASFAVSASTTTFLWLTDDGTLTAGPVWPTGTAHVRLASVIAGATTITSITDARIAAVAVTT